MSLNLMDKSGVLTMIQSLGGLRHAPNILLCFHQVCEVAHALQLQTEHLKKPRLDKYKVKNKDFYVLQAAARLWAAARVPFEEARSVVLDAFQGAIDDA